MGKIYTKKLLSFFLLLLVSMPFYASALPTGADTCNVEEMSKGAHGVSNLKSPAGYSVAVAMKSPGSFELTFTGPGDGFEGILAYVMDGNNRVGKFVDIPANIRFKDDCGVPSGTVTHKSSDNKPFPFKLTWNAPQGASGDLTVKSLIVKGFKDWAQLDDLKFNAISGATTGSAPSSSDNTGAGGSGSGSDGFLQKYLLFIIMIAITTVLYIVGSITEAMLKRQQIKSRSYAKTIKNGFDETNQAVQ